MTIYLYPVYLFMYSIAQRLVDQDTRLADKDKVALKKFFHIFCESDKFTELQKNKKKYEAIISIMMIAMVLLSLLFLSAIGGMAIFLIFIFLCILTVFANHSLTQGIGAYVAKHIFGEEIAYSRNDIYFPYTEEFIKKSGLLEKHIDIESKKTG